MILGKAVLFRLTALSQQHLPQAGENKSSVPQGRSGHPAQLFIYIPLLSGILFFLKFGKIVCLEKVFFKIEV